jgi:2Fe-2S ferredoxin
MSIFGIRKKIKKALGVSKPPAAPVAKLPQFSMTLVVDEEREFSYSQDLGTSLLMASGNLEVPIASGCSDASCATCRCEILEGANLLSASTDAEKATLTLHGFDTSMRLACSALGVKEGSVRVRAAEVLD